jgi:hypothetical protein
MATGTRTPSCPSLREPEPVSAALLISRSAYGQLWNIGPAYGPLWTVLADVPTTTDLMVVPDEVVDQELPWPLMDNAAGSVASRCTREPVRRGSLLISPVWLQPWADPDRPVAPAGRRATSIPPL